MIAAKRISIAALLFFGATVKAQIGLGGSSNARRINGVAVSQTAPNNGQTLVYNATTKAWEPADPGTIGSGGVQVKADGTNVGSATGNIDLIAPTAGTPGITPVVANTGTKVTVQLPLPSAAALKSDVQAGGSILCSAGNTTSLTCAMSPQLTAYTDKMLVNLCVTGAITGATTLAIDGLASKSVLNASGTTPASGDLGTGCRIVYYQASDNSFRLPPAGGSSPLPTQTGNGGKYLLTDGSTTAWGSPLPTQTGNGGKYLLTDGSTPAWGTVVTGISPTGIGKIIRHAVANINTDFNFAYGMNMFAQSPGNTQVEPTATTPFMLSGVTAGTWTVALATGRQRYLWSGDSYVAEWGGAYTPASSTSYVATALLGSDSQTTLANFAGLGGPLVGFRYGQASSQSITDSAWMCVTKPSSGGAVSTASTGVSFTSGAFMKFRLEKAGSAYKFYINGTQVCNSFTPAITADAPLRIESGMSNVDASPGVHTYAWGYFYIEADK